MRKLCLSLTTSLVLLAFFSYSRMGQEEVATAELAGLEETRAWFEATYQANGNSRAGGKQMPYLSDVKIGWEKAKRAKIKNNEGFTIPLSHNRVMWGASDDKLAEVPPLRLVVMEKNGERYAFLVVMQPDNVQNGSLDPRTFTGKVRVLDWEGHPVKG